MAACYILQSEKDFSYYIGSTEDLEARIVKHNKGYSRYTKAKRPWKIVYNEEYKTLSEAKRREYYMKSLKSKIAIEKIINNGPIVYRPRTSGFHPENRGFDSRWGHL
jgi:putative endonuclease